MQPIHSLLLCLMQVGKDGEEVGVAIILIPLQDQQGFFLQGQVNQLGGFLPAVDKPAIYDVLFCKESHIHEIDAPP